MRVAVIEDDPDIGNLVTMSLRLRWPTVAVDLYRTGEDALREMESALPDIIVLDIGLPGMNGETVLRRLRDHSDAPVVMLTSRTGAADVARLLEAGADDYIGKPFNPIELLSRLNALLRRSRGQNGASKPALAAGDLFMDFAAASVQCKGTPVHLTRTELQILESLVRNAQRVVTHTSLAAVAERSSGGDAADAQLVRTYIQRIRSRLGDSASHPHYIESVRGQGYKFLLAVSQA